MHDFPRAVRYHERLTGQSVEVELPQTRSDAFDLIATLDRLAAEDPDAWRWLYRQYTASDWYVLGLLLSPARKLDIFTGRSWVDHDFQFRLARELQFDGSGVLRKDARGHGKSFWRNLVGVTARVLQNPDFVVAIVAHEKSAAMKHAMLTAAEWRDNPELKLAWSDVFFADPEKESPLWSQERGYLVRRSIQSVMPTLSAHTILQVPTGGRVGLFVFDDVENEETATSEDMRQKTLDRFSSFLKTGDVLPEVWINGTHHHPQGLVKQLENGGVFRVRFYPAEDTSSPAPDIAALCDAAGGKWPNGAPFPPGLRHIRLDGAPTFQHPLALANKRLEALGVAGGLASYMMQMMGDPHAGQEKRLPKELLRWYKETPEERAKESVLVMTVDGSKGVGDPTFAMVWALHVDQTISWVGALRRKLPPSGFGPEIFRLWGEWQGIGRFDHIRVESYGQATYGWQIESYFEARGQWVRVLEMGRTAIQNRLREWQALEPMLRMGRFHFPQGGLMAFDEVGQRYDLCKYFVEQELDQFPIPNTDDGLASMALLGEPEDPKRGIGPLPFPESDEAWLMRERSSGHAAPRRADRDWSEDNWWTEGEL